MVQQETLGRSAVESDNSRVWSYLLVGAGIIGAAGTLYLIINNGRTLVSQVLHPEQPMFTKTEESDLNFYLITRSK